MMKARETCTQYSSKATLRHDEIFQLFICKLQGMRPLQNYASPHKSTSIIYEYYDSLNSRAPNPTPPNPPVRQLPPLSIFIYHIEGSYNPRKQSIVSQEEFSVNGRSKITSLLINILLPYMPSFYIKNAIALHVQIICAEK